MALQRRRMFASGADNAPAGTSPMGFDPGALMPPERPSTPFSSAPTPGPHGGGVGGSVNRRGAQATPASGAGASTSADGSSAGMAGGSPAGGGAPPVPIGPSPLPVPGQGPISPESATMYTGQPDTPAQFRPTLGAQGRMPTSTVLSLLRMLGRL